MSRINKKVIAFIFSLLVILSSYSCGSDDSDSLPEDVNLQLLSSDPQNNATVDPATTSIKLDFNKEIFYVNRNNVTLNGTIVLGVTFANNVLTILLNNLEENTEYTLQIGINAIRVEPGVSNDKAFLLTFRTTEYPRVEIAPDLVTLNPSNEAKKLYQYLRDNYKSKVISGMMANVSWNNTESERVYQLTGKYPALNCYDYIHLAWSPANWIDYSDITPIKTWWEAGGIVAAGWHWTVPTAEGVTDPAQMTYKPQETSFRAKNAIVEGTWENKIMKADLTKIANYLKLLQTEGIPVLWRPLHEAAGNIYEYNGGTAWFWWGYDGAETYRKLWIYMFDYFQSIGLNNLIWVWTTQTKDNAFYPGDTYVDIIGRDLYNQNTTNCIAQYETITSKYPNKLAALTECGSVALLSEQWTAGARWSWFMPWYGKTDSGEPHGTDDWWTNAMSQTYVVSRDQLPSFK